MKNWKKTILGAVVSFSLLAPVFSMPVFAAENGAEQRKGVGIFGILIPEYSLLFVFAAAWILMMVFMIMQVVKFYRLSQKGKASTKKIKFEFQSPRDLPPNEYLIPPEETPQAMKALAAQGKCMHCQSTLPPNSVFCSRCGKQQEAVLERVFVNTFQSETDFVNHINHWLYQFSHIRVLSADFDKETTAVLLGPTNQYRFNAVRLKYSPSTLNEPYLFQIGYLFSLGQEGNRYDDMIQEWMKNNPKARIISQSGGTHMRGTASSLAANGIGAMNHTQIFVLYQILKSDVV